MENHDFRVVRAREFLARARRREVAVLSPRALARENAELRRALGWVIDVVDDYADTDLDLDVSQIMLWGGVYLKPADVLALCPGCLNRAADASNAGAGGSPGAICGEGPGAGRQGSEVVDLDTPTEGCCDGAQVAVV
jgi:hypothetical protein